MAKALVVISILALCSCFVLATRELEGEIMQVTEGMVDSCISRPSYDGVAFGRDTVITTEVNEAPAVGGEEYCCLRNGFGCMQMCDKSKTYKCCLRNGFGCMQQCEEGAEYFCCRKNGFGCQQKCKSGSEYYCCKKNPINGCVEMCPKK